MRAPSALLAAFLACLPLFGGCDAHSNADEEFLRLAWREYKQTFISPEGYVWDRFRLGGEVTSEGQSYALLRAAWLRDEEAFRKVLAWTDAHLLRTDGLFSWRWLPHDGGRIDDPNTATDADTDIAFALIIAAHAFQDKTLLQRAVEIIIALRQHCRLDLPQGWCLAAGNWAVEERIYNPSYFAPYAYAYFHELDPKGGWPQATETGYDLLARTIALSQDKLIANFVVVDVSGGVLPVQNKEGLESVFSFDAMRTYWRVALDCLLRKNPRACADPARTSAMAQLLARDGAIYSRYALDGTRQSDVVSISFYGALLPAFRLFAPHLADALLRNQLSRKSLLPLLTDPDRYYDLNWTWFGLAADNGLIQRNTPSPEHLRH